MSKLEIRLANGSLDLNPDSQSKFYITKQIHDLRDLETRNASFTKSIVIPRSYNNVFLLGLELVEFGRDSTDSYKFVDCQVLLASYPVLSEGKLIVTSQNDTDKTITINILGGTVTLFEELSENGLGDLPLVNYSFDWNLGNISNYVDTTDGLLFADSSWGGNNAYAIAVDKGLSPNVNFEDPEVNYNGAWFYVKTLMSLIFDSLKNVTIDNTALESLEDYNSMVVMIPTTQLLDNFTALEGIEGVRSALPNTETTPLISVGESLNLNFPEEYADSPTGFWNSGGLYPYRYEVTTSAYYNIDININFFMSPPSSSLSDLQLVAGTDFGGTVLFDIPVGFSSQNKTYKKSVYLNAGESIRLVFVPFTGDPLKLVYNGDFNVSSSITIDSDFVNLSEWMPDISQKNFVKEVFKLFNAIPTFKDGLTTIDLWDSITEREQEDLTQYLDSSRDIIKQGYLNSYAQNNTFKFSVDEDVEREGTEFVFPMKNNILPLDKDKISSSFSPSDQSVEDQLSISTPLMPFDYEKVTNNNLNVTSGTDTYSTVDSNGLKVGDLIFAANSAGTGFQPRRRVKQVIDNKTGTVDINWSESSNDIWDFVHYYKEEIGLRFGKVFQKGSTRIRDGGANILVPSMKGVVFPDAYTWENLAGSYYTNLVSMLEKPVTERMFFRLPPTVFNELDLLKPVYVKDRAYYINKIEQYNFSGFCRMELLEIKVNEGIIGVPYYIATPNPLIFGNVEPSTTTTKKATILNTGLGEISFNINPITGADSSYFSFVGLPSNPINLVGGGALEVEIEFISDTSFGEKQAEFNIEGITEGLFDIDVKIDAFINSQADYTVTPLDIIVTPTPSGFETVASTVIENVGIGSIDFDLGDIIGSSEIEFTLGTQRTFTLLEGQQITASVKHISALPIGLKQATFLVETITPDIFNKTVDIFARTIDNPATYTVSLNPMAFGSKSNNAPASTLQTIIQNTGTETINFTLTTFTGANANEFDYAVGQPIAFSVDPNQQQSINVVWDTANPKTFKQAFFTIEANNAFASNTIVEVNGTTT